MRLSGSTMSLMPDTKGSHIRSIAMKNLFIWIILISTAAVGVAVAQPTGEDVASMIPAKHHQANV